MKPIVPNITTAFADQSLFLVGFAETCGLESEVCTEKSILASSLEEAEQIVEGWMQTYYGEETFYDPVEEAAYNHTEKESATRKVECYITRRLQEIIIPVYTTEGEINLLIRKDENGFAITVFKPRQSMEDEE